MAFGKVIPPAPVHKMRLGPKAPLKTPKDIDRFAECKHVITFIQVFINIYIYSHVCVFVYWDVGNLD